MKNFFLILFLSVIMVSSASAHRVWINVFESDGHNSPHAMVSLGWGHNLPMDDILTSTGSRVEMESFVMLNPMMQATEIAIQPFKLGEPEKDTGDMEMFKADMAARKIALKENCTQGVYQFSAISKPNFYTFYIDKKGKERLKLKSMDQIEDIEKVLHSLKYQAFAKSYLTVGPWKQPKPLGHGLEIVPLTDLSNLHPGDLVELSVTFYGKPLSGTGQNMEYIVAYSSGFGQNDNFFIGAYVKHGKAQFRVQSPGQWLVGLYHKRDVSPDGPLRDLQGKAKQVYHSASLTFNVK